MDTLEISKTKTKTKNEVALGELACLLHTGAHVPSRNDIFSVHHEVSYAHEITGQLLSYFAGDCLIVEQPVFYKYHSYTTDERLCDNFIVAYAAISHDSITRYFGITEEELTSEHFGIIKEELQKCLEIAYNA
ncbi:MAG: hypothetical protein ACTIJH_11880 [Moraxellaceae bacterium]